MTIDHPPPSTRDAIYQQLIVTLPKNMDIGEARIALRKALADVDYEALDFIEEIRAELFQLAQHEDLTAIAARLVNAGVAEAAEQNRPLQQSAAVNDPLYRHQWPLPHIGAEAAWLRVPSVVNPAAPGVVVAVADTGIRTAHPDFLTHLWTDAFGHHGRNLIDGGHDVYDGDGHGTRLAGTIGARSNDGVGVAAADWPIRLMAMKFIDMDRPPNAWTGAWAIVLAALNGAKIINAAWGVGIRFAVLEGAIAFAGAWQGGALVVAAAGNDGLDNDVLPTYPASFKMLPNLISVMASGYPGRGAASPGGDDKAWFSNYGQTTVHLAAPGVRVLTTDTYLGTPQWRTYSGTSAACAYVTYAAALIKAMNPLWRPAEIRDHLIASAEGSRWLKCVAGGRLNLERAVLGPFTITSPAAGQVWPTSTNQSITWTNSYATGVPTTTVTLELSKNGGPYAVLAPGKANNGVCPVGAPNAPVAAARLRIRSVQAPAFYAESPIFKVQ
jgi:subtilisin family serine protease